MKASIRRRKIALQTWGSDGDIHPFIALAGALAARGHEVTLALTSAERKSYQHYASHYGFGLIEVGTMVDSDAEMHRLANRLYELGNPLRQVSFVFDELLAPGIPEVHRVAKELCATHEMLIGHFILHPAHGAAEQAGVPYLSLTLNHSAIPTRTSPPVGAPDLGPFFNRLTWAVAMALIEHLVGSRINRWRRSVDLPPLRSFRDVWEAKLGNLIAVSPQFCPMPPDWDARQQVCGFFPPPNAGGAVGNPESVEEFLASGPAPVYFTFGSMLAAAQEREKLVESVRLMVEAAHIAGCRAIVQAPWSRLSDIDAGAEILRIERAPHDRIFPRCTLVVHHGGAGTTQTAAMCGRPSVVVAHITDQYFWGRELARLGVAPPLIERRGASSRALARAIVRVLSHPEMATQAKRLGERLSAEDGLARAVAIIEALAV